MNPFGAALMAYHKGRADACFTIERDDGYAEKVPVKLFFVAAPMPHLEQLALSVCRGTVLDVGAGAGRHSLALRELGFEIWSLETLPEAFLILGERGLPNPILGDIFVWTGRRFDTVLMLMNGIGLVGTPERLDDFLRHAHQLVTPAGQILCDTIDVSITTAQCHAAYRERNLSGGLFPGQQRFTIEFDGVKSAPFDWLHLDFATLAKHAEAHDWDCQLLEQQNDGHYLARMVPKRRPHD